MTHSKNINQVDVVNLQRRKFSIFTFQCLCDWNRTIAHQTTVPRMIGPWTFAPQTIARKQLPPRIIAPQTIANKDNCPLKKIVSPVIAPR